MRKLSPKKVFTSASIRISGALLRNKADRLHTKICKHFGLRISHAIKSGAVVYKRIDARHEWVLALPGSGEPVMIFYDSEEKRLTIHLDRKKYSIADIDYLLHKGNVKSDPRSRARAISRFEWGQIRHVWFQLSSEMTSAQGMSNDAEGADQAAA